MNNNPWQTPETAPQTITRVLAVYVGVFEPCTGFMQQGRFYADGESGSSPFTHWMPIPPLPNTEMTDANPKNSKL